MRMGPAIQAILFDLDGTLADTAPDMARTVNAMRLARRLSPVPLELVRPHVSKGARGMIGAAFGLTPEDAGFAGLREEFLDIYAGQLCVESRLFPEMPELLSALERRPLAWGVVTNKPGWLTAPLLQMLDINPTNACIVSGDTVGARKPHPLPLLHAAGLIAKAPAQCLYVGDAERDIAAGRAAGMKTVVAAWGYLGGSDDPTGWRADGVAASPVDLVSWLHPRHPPVATT